MSDEIEPTEPVEPEALHEDDWLSRSKACDLSEGECEACQ